MITEVFPQVTAFILLLLLLLLLSFAVLHYLWFKVADIHYLLLALTLPSLNSSLPSKETHKLLKTPLSSL